VLTAQRRKGRHGQLRLDLQDRNPTPASMLAALLAADWTHEAEPVPNQPLNGYQFELFPRSPEQHTHS
jgi:hypothetical protein